MKKSLLLVAGISLILAGCSFIEQPTSNSGSISNQSLLQNQVVLDLSNQGLEKIPDDVFKRTNLEELNASDNNITGAIQAEVRHLARLKVLNLSNNLMTGVPAEIGQLKNLEILDLSNNELTGLPYELGNLKKLKTLNISGNNYSEQDLNIILKSLPADTEIIK